MTAFELADMLEVTSSTFNDEAAAMLRKQDAQIKQLREALMACKAAGFIAEAKAKEALAATEEFQK